MTDATLSYAETLGMIAFEKGRPPHPGGDTQLSDALKEVGAISKDGNRLKRAWLKGYHTANLKALASA